MKTLVALAVVCSASFLIAEELPTKKTVDDWLKSQVETTRNRIKAAEKGTISAKAKGDAWNEKAKRYHFKTRQAKDNEVKRLRAELAAPTLPTLNPLALHDGEIGRLGPPANSFSYTKYHVVQIINEHTAMIRASIGNNYDARFFLDSPVVKSLQEDQDYERLIDVAVVDGTRKYTTTMGAASTIPMVREYDLGPHLKKLQK
jgi:hypothetical protein